MRGYVTTLVTTHQAEDPTYKAEIGNHASLVVSRSLEQIATLV